MSKSTGQSFRLLILISSTRTPRGNHRLLFRDCQLVSGVSDLCLRGGVVRGRAFGEVSAGVRDVLARLGRAGPGRVGPDRGSAPIQIAPPDYRVGARARRVFLVRCAVPCPRAGRLRRDQSVRLSRLAPSDADSDAGSGCGRDTATASERHVSPCRVVSGFDEDASRTHPGRVR